MILLLPRGAWALPALSLVLSLIEESAWPGPARRERAPVAFRQEWLTPFLEQEPVQEARRLLEAGQPRRAATLFRRHLRRPHPREEIQARYLLAHALLAEKGSAELAEAAEIFSRLVEAYPLLRDYHRFYAARALLRLRRYAQAEAQAAAVAEGSVLHLEAQLLRAEALYQLRRLRESSVIYRAYLRQHPAGGQAETARFRLAEALEQEVGSTSRPTAASSASSRREEALELYKQLLIRAPLSRLRAVAERRLALLARQVPDGPGRARLTEGQRFEQALVYFKANRNPESEAAFAAVLRERAIKPQLRCKATFYQAKSIFKQRQRGRAAATYQEAAKVCRQASEVDLVVKSLYDGGRGLIALKQYAEAIRQFEVIEKEFPGHSFADDARLWASEVYELMGKKEEMKRVLVTLPDRYPGGDMAHEALWRLARQSYLERKYPEALQHLDRSLTKLGRPRYYYALGQALYWKARILELTGKPAPARGLYNQCIREYPLSYYALLAFNRLRERHRAHYQRLFNELIARVGEGHGRWTFPARPLFSEAGFLRAVELARLGFGADAARELALVGLKTMGRTSDSGDDLWLAAVLYDRAGLWHLSHQVPRSMDTSYRRSYPLAEGYRRWAIAYPRAFWPLVRASAKSATIPEELVLSIMREESGFSRTIESYANAVGLMQLILPTAQAAGKQQRLVVSRERLHDPSLNIRLGATYLGFLVRSFDRVLPLAIAGYNAGEGAASRWLRQLDKVPLDEFIERIPFDQTRRYTKRVLSTLFVYSLLYKAGSARVPVLGQRLPRVTAQSFGTNR